MSDTKNRLYNTAYKKLKQTVYYDTDLFAKIRLAEYESAELTGLNSKDKEDLLKIFATLESKEILSAEQKAVIDAWIDQVNFYVLPKSVSPFQSKKEIERRGEREKTEVCNVLSSEKYYWHGLNYCSNIPIPLLMLDVLWIMKVGVYLETEISDQCYGNRVHEILQERKESDASGHLMKRYANQYAAWRNKALTCATEAVEKNEIVDILTLDFAQFYYHIEGDFAEIREYLQKLKRPGKYNGDYQIAIELTNILEKIHEKYYDVIRKYTDVTHRSIKERGLSQVLPIGLYSSGILANWHLKEFDKKILESIQPRYYGRYVDDCILVLARPKYSGNETPSVHTSSSKREILQKFFVDTGIFTYSDGKDYQQDLNGKILPNQATDTDIVYRLCDDRFAKPRITVQNNKVMLYHVDPEHSTDILRLFQKKIQENASVFQYLPEESVTDSQDTGMHQLVFDDGSTHKLRNLKKLMVDNSKFSIVLSKQLSHISLCSKPIPKISEFTKNMFRDLRGNNYLSYTRIWEKVFCLLLFSKKGEQTKEACNMYGELLEQISRLSPATDLCGSHTLTKNEEILVEQVSVHLIRTLHEYLRLSIAIPLTLFSKKNRIDLCKEFSTKSKVHFVKNPDTTNTSSSLDALSRLLRSANLFPQQYVIYPLLNYLKDYEGDLLEVDVFNTDLLTNPELDDKKLELSPRFIHLYEYQLYFVLQNLKTMYSLTCCPHNIEGNMTRCHEPYCCYMQQANHLFQNVTFKRWADYRPNVEVSPLPAVKFGGVKPVCPTKIVIESNDPPNPNKEGKIRIGLANLRIRESWKSRCHAPQELPPDISLERWLEISRVLNAAIRDKCDLVVFPECSIPHYWIAKLAQWSKQHQIGLICGIEYLFDRAVPKGLSRDRNTGKCIAFNVTAAFLPFRVKNLYNSCSVSLRVKNHYAPDEIFELNKCGYALPDSDSYVYHLYHWRDTQFTVYNCFELADIQHRAIFRSELDCMIACSLNKDVHYFMDILESVARDIHCYVIYSNTAEFGCSRVLQPTKYERRNVMQVGGGVSSTLLTGDLDIATLATFQSHGYDKTDETFKPLPPGFDSSRVIMRHTEKLS